MVEGDRRRKIVAEYASLSVGKRADDCVYFVRHTCRCRSISHFLDTAKESNVERLERLLEL